jgi:hypothetical protein
MSHWRVLRHWLARVCGVLALVSSGCGGGSSEAGSGAAGSSSSAGTNSPASSSAAGAGGLLGSSGEQSAEPGGAAMALGGSAASSDAAGASALSGGGASGGSASGGGASGGGASGGAASVLTSKDFACSELIGLWVASQWWDSFEKGVPNDQWQFAFQHHGYLEMFADPASPYWANAVSSKCTASAATPDRVIFLPFSLSLMTLDEWLMNLKQVVETMKGKFPGVKRIELMTTLRSPGNMPCANDTDPNTVVAPYVDQAIQMVADASGGLVTVGPKIELTSCAWWAGGTDLTGAGNTGVGQLLSAYYQTH